jgi:hypothetical protein
MHAIHVHYTQPYSFKYTRTHRGAAQRREAQRGARMHGNPRSFHPTVFCQIHSQTPGAATECSCIHVRGTEGIHRKWLAAQDADARDSRVNAPIAPERIDPRLSKPEPSIFIKCIARSIQKKAISKSANLRLDITTTQRNHATQHIKHNCQCP